MALFDSAIHVNTKGKKVFDADIVVQDEAGEDLGIELRCGIIQNIIKAFTDHPNADLYLFMFKDYNNALSQLLEQLKGRDYIYKKLNINWVIVLAA